MSNLSDPIADFLTRLRNAAAREPGRRDGALFPN